jgi:predicted outer membrane lipoprotein
MSMLGYLEWHFRAADPNFAGWLTVGAYALTAILCFFAGRSYNTRIAGEATRNQSHVFWYVLAVILVLMGINKQLDFQILLTEIGRNIAKAGGWYERRLAVQEYFLAGLGGAGLMALAFFGWLIRRAFWRQVFALFGALLLACFAMVRALSIEHVDQMLGLDLGGVQVHFLLESVGILIIAFAAAINIALRRCKM